MRERAQMRPPMHACYAPATGVYSQFTLLPDPLNLAVKLYENKSLHSAEFDFSGVIN
jgi:hypothetical protein